MIVYEQSRTLPITDFYEELQFEFPSLPPQLFEYYVRRAARMMVQKAHLVRRRLILIADPGVTRYAVDLPDGLELNSILGIRRVNGCGDIGSEVPRSFDPPETSCACHGVAWYDPQEKVLHLDDGYCNVRFYVTMSVMPSDKTCSLPAEFKEDLLPTLMMGTKGMILMITGRPWTNLRVGQACYNEFLQLTAAEGVRMATNKQAGAVRMQFGRAL